jgi:hypothetical protein
MFRGMKKLSTLMVMMMMFFIIRMGAIADIPMKGQDQLVWYTAARFMRHDFFGFTLKVGKLVPGLS